MSSVKSYFFDNAKNDIEIALNMLKNKTWTADEVNIIKSSIFIIAYNAIEGSLTTILTDMFLEYNNDSPKMKDLSNKRKAFVAEYVNIKYKNKQNSPVPINNKDNFFKMLFDLPIDGFDFDACINQHHSINMKNIQKIKKHKYIQINGNANEQIFEKISDLLELGFDIDLNHEYKVRHLKYKVGSLAYKSFYLKKPKPLYTITQKRNELCHGQDYFSNASTTQSIMSVEDIEELMISAILYIDLFSGSVNFFIKHKLRRDKGYFINILIYLLRGIAKNK